MADPRKDPLPVFAFHVSIKIAGGAVAFFKSVSGLKYDTEVLPIRAGGVNDTTYQIVGATKWNNIVLKRGFTGDSKLLEWRDEWLTRDREKTRAGGTITQLDSALKPVCSWTWVRGWPCKWEITEFDASKSEIAIETLEIAHDGLIFGDANGTASPRKGRDA